MRGEACNAGITPILESDVCTAYCGVPDEIDLSPGLPPKTRKLRLLASHLMFAGSCRTLFADALSLD